MSWAGRPIPAPPNLGVVEWGRFVLRAVIVVGSSLGLVLLLLLALGIQRVIGGRYLSDVLTRHWGRIGRICGGLTLEIRGQEMTHGGAIVANHSSWMDIFVLHNSAHVHFVSKAEVASWPGMGPLAKAAGTLFIERKRTEAKRQQQQLAERISAGDRLCFFPEGTSTDSLRVLPFKTALFSVFHTPELRDLVWVQPVSVAYLPPKHLPDYFYGWWGEMEFGPSLKSIFGRSRQGRVVVTFHPPLKASDYGDRKALALAAENVVRAGLKEALGGRYKG